ncbi:MAG: peptide-methionine (S)-S-oxide reductase MsrA [Nonlabens sp.]|nr:peptide-methionine (S)-S-oxide reductase MsrA [Nonlabens sp.]
MKLLSIIAIVIAAAGCNESSTSNNNEPQPKPVEVASEQGMEKAYFASGCFWCVEEIYESVIGVNEAVSGYAGGKDNNPTYRNHGDHAEAVEVQYDPTKVTFKTLVDVYFASQYIEQKNGQGPDNGHSYRSIVFYQNDAQKKIIDDKIAALTKEGYDVAAEVKSFQKFWIAEDYHQDYAKLNPNQGYIQSVSIPRFKRFAAKMPQVIKPNARH